ncbi:MAG: hypothetical protein AAFV29_12645, partial [Myxococcota bacterium]
MHLALVSHGRRASFLSAPCVGTLGWISETVPVVLSLDRDGLDLVDQAAQQLDDINTSGHAFGVYKYLPDRCDAAFEALPEPEISLNIRRRSGQSLASGEGLAELVPDVALRTVVTPCTQRVFLLSGGYVED